MQLLMTIGVVAALIGLCFAGFAIGLLIRKKPMNTCGCGRGHSHGHRKKPTCDASCAGRA